uniref:Uncharacterized protein n=1 Tax=Kalanchoe fedtschenkoi TaxID=63787 RepID=A0A7N0VCC6_KALFE
MFRDCRPTTAGDSTPEELATATQVQGSFMPIVREKPAVELVKVTDEMKSYSKLRLERTNQLGARMKRAAEAEEEKKLKQVDVIIDIVMWYRAFIAIYFLHDCPLNSIVQIHQ